MLALVNALITAFGNLDIGSQPDNSYLWVRAYGVSSALSQIFAVVGIVISIILYAELGFYASDEMGLFVNKFSFLMVFPLLFTTAALLLALTSINIHVHLLYENVVAIVVVCFTCVGILPAIFAWVHIDLTMHKVRLTRVTSEAIKRTRASTSTA